MNLPHAMKKSDHIFNLEVLKRAVFFAFLLVDGMAKAEDWTTYQHDTAHTGRTSADFDPTLLQKAWSAPQGYGTPLIAGNAVYAMKNGSTAVTSFNLSNGAINWSDPYQLVFSVAANVC